MDVFRLAPYLAILEKRKDLLPKDPTSVERKTLEKASSHLRSLLFRNLSPSPADPLLFFLEANLVAFSPSRKIWEKFALYYAILSIPLFQRGDPLLQKHFPYPHVLPLADFLSTERPFPQLKLYHVEVSGGKVFLGDRHPLYGASLLYSSILRWIDEKVRKIVLSGALEDLRSYAQKALQPPFRRKKKYPFIQKLLSAVGIPDGRKRILFYWLIPYWVTVEGKSPEEVLDLANEWIGRQSGGKIYSSWILAEAENVRSKGIKPWSLEKVEKVDPELVKMLRGMGLL